MFDMEKKYRESFLFLVLSVISIVNCQIEDDYRPVQSRSENQQLRETRDAFYPSFPSFQTQPSGHSRPFYPVQLQQEAAYSHRPQGAHEQRFDYDSAKYVGYKEAPIKAAASDNVGVLGSGNFGVIKGGTFYQAGEDNSNYEDDYSFYQNGHGRPSSFHYRNQNPRPRQHEQFANFRDFADINTPSYSQYIVIYANKNGTRVNDDFKRRPKNIFEQLELSTENEEMTTANLPPSKKISKFKRKMALLSSEKKIRAKKTANSEARTKIEEIEPLLALS